MIFRLCFNNGGIVQVRPAMRGVSCVMQLCARKFDVYQGLLLRQRLQVLCTCHDGYHGNTGNIEPYVLLSLIYIHSICRTSATFTCNKRFVKEKKSNSFNLRNFYSKTFCRWPKQCKTLDDIATQRNVWTWTSDMCN